MEKMWKKERFGDMADLGGAYFIVYVFVFKSQFNSTRQIVNAASLPNTVISVVQSGSTNTSPINLGPNPNPVGTNVTVDVRIDNSPNIWGWWINTVFSWNATLLQLVKVRKSSPPCG